MHTSQIKSARFCSIITCNSAVQNLSDGCYNVNSIFNRAEAQLPKSVALPNRLTVPAIPFFFRAHSINPIIGKVSFVCQLHKVNEIEQNDQQREFMFIDLAPQALSDIPFYAFEGGFVVSNVIFSVPHIKLNAGEKNNIFISIQARLSDEILAASFFSFSYVIVEG